MLYFTKTTGLVKSLKTLQNIYVFERSLLCSRLYLFNQKYSKNSIIVKYDYNFKKKLINFCDAMLNGLQSSVSHDDTSEIILIWWFGAQETIININNVENSF